MFYLHASSFSPELNPVIEYLNNDMKSGVKSLRSFLRGKNELRLNIQSFMQRLSQCFLSMSSTILAILSFNTPLESMGCNRSPARLHALNPM